MGFLRGLFKRRPTELELRKLEHESRMSVLQQLEDKRIERLIEQYAQERFMDWKHNQQFAGDEMKLMLHGRLMYFKQFYGPYNISDMKTARYMSDKVSIEELITKRYEELKAGYSVRKATEPVL